VRMCCFQLCMLVLTCSGGSRLGPGGTGPQILPLLTWSAVVVVCCLELMEEFDEMLLRNKAAVEEAINNLNAQIPSM